MWRRLVRMPPSKENRIMLNKIYRLYAWRYKAMNKTNYGPLCFHALFIYENLTEPLQDLWCKVYNASMKGHPGRNMGLDALMEKVNRAAKQMLEGAASDERITAILPELNVVHRVELAHDMAFGSHNFNHRKTGLPDLEPDVDVIRGLFHTVLPRNSEEWPPESDRNALNDRRVLPGDMPWKKIAAGQHEWRKYAIMKMRQFTFAAD